jgi:hypothetical protein
MQDPVRTKARKFKGRFGWEDSLRHHHQFFSSFSTIDQLTPGGAVLSRLLARI